MALRRDDVGYRGAKNCGPRPAYRPNAHLAAACFVPRGRNGLNGRLITPLQARAMVLPPSVQVCVPLSLALRRTKLPPYFAS